MTVSYSRGSINRHAGSHDPTSTSTTSQQIRFVLGVLPFLPRDDASIGHHTPSITLFTCSSSRATTLINNATGLGSPVKQLLEGGAHIISQNQPNSGTGTWPLWYHTPATSQSISTAAPEFLNSPGILRTASQTFNNVSWSCLVDVRHLSPSMLFKTTSRAACHADEGLQYFRDAKIVAN